MRIFQLKARVFERFICLYLFYLNVIQFQFCLAKQVLEMNGVAPLGELQMVAKDLYDKVTVLKYLTENQSITKEEKPNSLNLESIFT